ncbi:hypothetical protein CEXT_275231 [Caerostris extrusa]|uniref:Uncharacterized protein n=1 Tax=Caerostris extrusa TaxID=172846 RepID=A0AAV4X5F4_CAEEX|nr:hypothetical protein CEXT_275231 [Caerostris extrusa]
MRAVSQPKPFCRFDEGSAFLEEEVAGVADGIIAEERWILILERKKSVSDSFLAASPSVSESSEKRTHVNLHMEVLLILLTNARRFSGETFWGFDCESAFLEEEVAGVADGSLRKREFSHSRKKSRGIF